MVCTEFPRGLLIFEAPLLGRISLQPPPTFDLSEPGTYLTHYQIHIPTHIHTAFPAMSPPFSPSPGISSSPPLTARRPTSLMPSNSWARAFTPISSRGRRTISTTLIMSLPLHVKRSPHVRRSYPTHTKRPRTRSSSKSFDYLNRASPHLSERANERRTWPIHRPTTCDDRNTNAMPQRQRFLPHLAWQPLSSRWIRHSARIRLRLVIVPFRTPRAPRRTPTFDQNKWFS